MAPQNENVQGIHASLLHSEVLKYTSDNNEIPSVPRLTDIIAWQGRTTYYAVLPDQKGTLLPNFFYTKTTAKPRNGWRQTARNPTLWHIDRTSGQHNKLKRWLELQFETRLYFTVWQCASGVWTPEVPNAFTFCLCSEVWKYICERMKQD